ncbi:TonB-dependent receptor plug domain-containing protein [bacterium]
MKRLLQCVFLFYGFMLINDGIGSPCPDSLYLAHQIKITDAQKYNYRYLGDILSHVPGLWIRDTGLPGQWSSGRIWGCYDNQLILLIDGQILNDPWTGSHDLNLIPVEMIERVEVYPTMNPFARTAIGGVVNIVSKNITSNKPYTKIVYRSGKDAFSDLDVTFGQKLSSKLDIISGVILKKYGESIPSEKYSAQKTRAKIRFRPSENLFFGYSVLHNKYDVDIPYSFPVAGDTILLTSPHRKRIQYNHLLQMDWNVWKLKNSLTIDYTTISQENYDKPLSLRKIIPVHRTGIQLKQNYSIQNMHLTWGLETKYYHLQIPDSTKYKESTTHAFLMGEFLLSPEVNTLFQIQAHRSFDNKWSILPAFQFQWSGLKHLALWAGYSQSLREPSLGERFGYLDWIRIPVTLNQIQGMEHAHPYSPNSSLQPETSQTIDAGTLWRISPQFHVKLRGYYRWIRNLIEIESGPEEWQYINGADNQFSGIEGEIEWNFWHSFQARLTLHIQKATDSNGNNLLERPNFLSNTAITWQRPLFKGDLDVFLRLNYRFISDYWNYITGNPADAYLQINGPAHLLDFKATFFISKRGGFTFAVDNILGTEIATVSNFPLPGLSTRIGFSWELFE